MVQEYAWDKSALAAMVGNALGLTWALSRNGKPISCFGLGSMFGSGIGGGNNDYIL